MDAQLWINCAGLFILSHNKVQKAQLPIKLQKNHGFLTISLYFTCGYCGKNDVMGYITLIITFSIAKTLRKSQGSITNKIHGKFFFFLNTIIKF